MHNTTQHNESNSQFCNDSVVSANQGNAFAHSGDNEFEHQANARKQYEADLEAEAFGIVRPRRYQVAV